MRTGYEELTLLVINTYFKAVIFQMIRCYSYPHGSVEKIENPEIRPSAHDH